MIRWSVLAISIALSMAIPSASRADLILSISSADDLNNLAVGATATFDISVSGTADDAPGYLSASILLDPAVFVTTLVTPGAIIPDISGFDSSATGGATVSAYYDDSIFGTAPITTDGIFYSFSLMRISGDETTLSFSGFAAQDDLGNNISITALPDSLSIPAAPAAVPAPPSWILSISAIALMGPGRLARGLRRFASRSRTDRAEEVSEA